ncbi:MAG: hypothetical protein KIS87_11200 [Phycisphaeraceae bacterium]|nr:hypothetical protein [Phycisphaeraceae bacterium]
MADHDPSTRAAPRPQPRVVLCPYCGSRSRDPHRCESCAGYFDPLSRQATQNAMGPWFIRDDAQPFRPGCSYDTLRTLIRRGKVGPETPIRGPTTRQFWVLAKRCPAVANLFGICHACARPVEPSDRACRHCGASFEPPDDRQQLGLGSVRLLPGHAPPEQVAALSDAFVGHTREDVGEVRNDPEPCAANTTVQVEVIAESAARLRAIEMTVRTLRRSRTVYFTVALLLLLTTALIFASPSLGIGLGALDRWLGRRAGGGATTLRQPDLSSDGVPTIRPAPSGESQERLQEPVGGVPQGEEADPKPDAAPHVEGEARSEAPSMVRLRRLATSGSVAELEEAATVADQAVTEGAARSEVTAVLEGVRMRLEWLALRGLP